MTMNKKQRSILTLEIVLLIIGIALILYSTLSPGKGGRGDMIRKLETYQSQLEEKKAVYPDNEKIISMIQDKMDSLTQWIDDLLNPDRKFDKALEERKILNYAAEIEIFFSDCDRVKTEIGSIKKFVDSYNDYIYKNTDNLRRIRASSRVTKAMKDEISELEKSLTQRVNALISELGEIQTPDECIRISLKTLDLQQPFVELRNKINLAISRIDEYTTTPKTQDIIPVDIPKPVRQTRQKNPAELLERLIPDYPNEFIGTGYMAHITIKIGTDGKPKSTSVSKESGNQSFDEFCRKEALKLKFKPAMGFYLDDPKQELFQIEGEAIYPFLAPAN